MFKKLSPLILSVFFSTVIAYGLSTSAVASLDRLNAPDTTNEFSSLLPESHHAKTLIGIQQALMDMHLTGYNMTDELADKVFDDFIDSNDPNRMFVIEKDYQYLTKYREGLAKNIVDGDLSFAYSAHTLIEQEKEKMYKEMLGYIQLLEQDDLSIGTTISEKSTTSARFASKSERLNYWKLMYQAKVITLMSEGSTFDEAKTELLTLLKNQIKYFNYADAEDVFSLFVNTLMNNVEAHTRYESPVKARQTNESTQNRIFGIGAQISIVDFFLTIKKVVPDSPAEKDGNLISGDRIIAVKPDDNSEWIPVTGMELSKATDLIKGEENTVVRLKIAREGESVSDPHEVSITRKPLTLTFQEVKYRIYATPYNKTEHKIGVIEIPAFYENVSVDVSNALENLQTLDVDGIIIDLRENGGGLLTEAQRVASLFLEGGNVVKTRNFDDKTRTLGDLELDNEYRGPLAVLINRWSASASEIVAGAIQDHKRGIILGERSFGKGTVQSYFSLDNFRKHFMLGDVELGSVAITQAKFYRPSGHSTQLKGVSPDVHFALPLDDSKWGESQFDSALPWDEIKVTDFKFKEWPSHLDIEELQSLSNERIAKDENIQYLNKMLNHKGNHTITLDIEAIKTKRKKRKEEDLQFVNNRLNMLGLPMVSDVKDAGDEIDNADVILDEAARVMDEIIQQLKGS